MNKRIHYFVSKYLVMEYVGPEKRTLVGNVPLASFLTLGAVTMPWIAYGLADWRLFAVVTSAPLGLIVIAWWIVPESSRWLVHKGRIDKTIEILKRCARINGKVVDPAVYDQFKVSVTYYSVKQNYFLVYLQMAVEARSILESQMKAPQWFDLFRTPKMRKRMLLTILNWFDNSFSFLPLKTFYF